MTLEERINEDLKQAVKAQDKVALRGLRAVKSAIQYALTDGSGEAMTPDREIKILQKMVKQRKESLETYEKQNRPDLATIEREEIELIERYLPQQLSGEELDAFIRTLIAEMQADASAMGRVIKEANQRLAGRAEGKAIAEAVKRLL